MTADRVLTPVSRSERLPVTNQQSPIRWMDEQFRPQYHYTAVKNMINDPNGLIHLDGQWHLFHQYNQHEVVHWGHATSTDLLHWEHQEPAIFPDVLGQIYSGTAVVDHENTSGLRTGAAPLIVAFFTYAGHEDGTQSQGLAYSNDRGRSWTKHPENPVVPNPGQKDFRDPKVFWHAPSHSWIMILTGGDHLEFFRSRDLIMWRYAFSWGAGHGSHDGVWECPDLFELPIEGADETRWVLSVSVDRGAPAGGSGMQYFVGDFDGHAFLNDNPPEMVLWQNWGQDYYAGITWENVPSTDGRRIMIAWADNWLYRFDIPTTPFNGQLTLPRELRLLSHEGELRLDARPIAELELLYQDRRSWAPCTVSDTPSPLLDQGDAYEVRAVFDLAASTASEFGIEVRVGRDQATLIGYDTQRSVLFLDRSRSGLIATPAVSTRHEAPLRPISDQLRLQILVDRSSVEMFTPDGIQITDLILPDPSSTGFRPYAVSGSAALTGLEVRPLARVWDDLLQSFSPLSGAWAQSLHDIRGSHNEFAIALMAEEALPVDLALTILGTREGNPGRILGERAAGIAVTDDGATGIVFLIDVRRNCFIASDLATGHEIAAVDAPFETNRPYRIVVAPVGDELEARIDDSVSLRVSCAKPPRRIALVLDDAEAVFNLEEKA